MPSNRRKSKRRTIQRRIKQRRTIQRRRRTRKSKRTKHRKKIFGGTESKPEPEPQFQDPLPDVDVDQETFCKEKLKMLLGMDDATLQQKKEKIFADIPPGSDPARSEEVASLRDAAKGIELMYNEMDEGNLTEQVMVMDLSAGGAADDDPKEKINKAICCVHPTGTLPNTDNLDTWIEEYKDRLRTLIGEGNLLPSDLGILTGVLSYKDRAVNFFEMLEEGARQKMSEASDAAKEAMQSVISEEEEEKGAVRSKLTAVMGQSKEKLSNANQQLESLNEKRKNFIEEFAVVADIHYRYSRFMNLDRGGAMCTINEVVFAEEIRVFGGKIYDKATISSRKEKATALFASAKRGFSGDWAEAAARKKAELDDDSYLVDGNRRKLAALVTKRGKVLLPDWENAYIYAKKKRKEKGVEVEYVNRALFRDSRGTTHIVDVIPTSKKGDQYQVNFVDDPVRPPEMINEDKLELTAPDKKRALAAVKKINDRLKQVPNPSPEKKQRRLDALARELEGKKVKALKRILNNLDMSDDEITELLSRAGAMSSNDEEVRLRQEIMRLKENDEKDNMTDFDVYEMSIPELEYFGIAPEKIKRKKMKKTMKAMTGDNSTLRKVREASTMMSQMMGEGGEDDVLAELPAGFKQ